MTGGLFFLCNPAANNGKSLRSLAAARAYLDRLGQPYEVALSSNEEDLVRRAREAASRSGIVVAGVGGDGTLSRIAGALAGTGVIMGAVPAGTGNDFARTLAIPTDPAAACDVLLHGETVAMDLGRINGRYFLNIAGVGLDAEVAAEAMRNFKGFPGSLAYLLALLKQLVVYRPCPVNITLDGRELHEVAWLIAVANARYFGGGMKVAPQADPWDGLADVVIVSGVSRLRFLSIFPRVYSGSHLLNDCVRVIRARAIRIEAKGQLAVQADGEPAGTTPFEVIMERQAVLFKVPRNKTPFYRPE